jgi:hypothetical protein
MTDSTFTVVSQLPPIDVEKRVGQFVMLRDMKAALKEKHDAEMKPINDTMEMIKDELKVALHSVNADNMKTSSGTVSLTTKYSASAADIGMFWTWVVTQAEFDMLDKKPNVTAIREYVEQHGVAPPGVNFNSFQDVGVRRSTK